MTGGNVYPLAGETFPRSLFGKPTRKGYRAAIKTIILNVQAAKNLSDLELADLLGCSRDTIENAKNEDCSLDVLTLLNIAYAFGEEVIDPVRELYLCKPVEPQSDDEELFAIERRIAAYRARKTREAEAAE